MNEEKLTTDDIACLISGIDKPSKCDDCISRQAVIEVIKDYASMLWKKYYEPFPESTILEMIQELPSVPAEQTHEEWCTDCKEYDQEQHCCHRYCKVIRQTVDEIKQAERTGHWEWVQYDYNPKLGNWHCSECKSVVMECVNKEEKSGIPLYKYCPQCGCRMVEPQESDN